MPLSRVALFSTVLVAAGCEPYAAGAAAEPAPDAAAQPDAPPAGPTSDGGTSAAADGDTAFVCPPDAFVCTTFASAVSFDGWETPDVGRPGSSTTLDEATFFSPPRSARLAIEQTLGLSPDARLRRTLPASRFASIRGRLRKSTQNATDARLVSLGGTGGVIALRSNGAVIEGIPADGGTLEFVTVIPAAPIANDVWHAFQLAVQLTERSVTIELDGTRRSAAITMGGPQTFTAALGPSEPSVTTAPSLIAWIDDVIVRVSP